MFLSLVIALGTLILAYIYFRNRSRNLPPGPYGLPVLGYSPFLGKNPIKTLTNLKKKYGNISCISLGRNKIIVLNDIKAVKEAIVKQGHNFSGRPDMILTKILFDGKDFGFTDGPIWKEQRKFSLQTLAEYRFGKTTLETTIMEQVDKLTTRLMTTQSDGQSVNITNMLFIPLMNVLWSITAGKQFENSDEHIQSFKETFEIATPAKWSIINHLPFFRFLFPGGLGYDKAKKCADRIRLYLRDEVAEHVDNFRENNLKDFIDNYLYEIAKRKEKGTDRPPYNREHLVGSVMILFVAGIDTTNTTLSWALLHIAFNPEIQEKVQKELDGLIAKDSFMSYTSKALAPYTEATLLEVQRHASTVPMNIPHRNHKDTTLFGYNIPKDSTIYINTFAIHYDEEYWDQPEVFRPERFLDESGTKVTKNESFAPFSLGPRQCIGESLAKMELFLFFTCLLRRFTFELVPNEPKPSLEPNISTLSRPKPFHLIVKPR